MLFSQKKIVAFGIALLMMTFAFEAHAESADVARLECNPEAADCPDPIRQGFARRQQFSFTLDSSVVYGKTSRPDLYFSPNFSVTSVDYIGSAHRLGMEYVGKNGWAPRLRFGVQKLFHTSTGKTNIKSLHYFGEAMISLYAWPDYKRMDPYFGFGSMIIARDGAYHAYASFAFGTRIYFNDPRFSLRLEQLGYVDFIGTANTQFLLGLNYHF